MIRSLATAALCLSLACAASVHAPDARAQDGVDGMRLLGRNEDEFAHMMDFHVVGDYAYASVGLGSGFQTYNISDPAHPNRVNRNGNPGWRAWAANGTAYNFLHDRGVEVFDISLGPAELVDSYDPAPGTSYEGGVRVGNYLYVAAHQEGIHVLDVGVRGSITQVDEILLSNNACWNVVEANGYLFVANGRFGLSVIDLAGGPSEVGTLPLLGLANDIEVAGSVAFLSLGPDGIASVDVSDPTNPVLLDRVPTLGNAFSMGLVGDILGVGSYPYAEWFDVSDPSALVRSGWDATKVYAMGADVGVTSGGDTVIVVADWRGMGVYAPESDTSSDIDVYPVRLDFGPVDAAGRDTTVIVRNNGLAILNVTSITTPSGVGVAPLSFSVAPGGTQEVTVSATGPGTIRSTISYVSDDPDEASFVQYVYANNTTFPQVGSVAPDFTLPGTDAQTHGLSDYRGKVVYLEFGAYW